MILTTLLNSRVAIREAFLTPPDAPPQPTVGKDNDAFPEALDLDTFYPRHHKICLDCGNMSLSWIALQRYDGPRD